MKNILVTGAASGIGRCFAEHYLQQADHSVIAVDCNPINISDAVPEPTSQLTKLHCDFADETSIRALAKQIGNIHLHSIIHSAGIRGLMPPTSKEETDTTHRETFDVLDNATMMRTFAINSAGTFTLLQCIMPQLRLASSQGSPAKVIIMTSRMGSVSFNTSLGGAYAYRASKAALNAIVKSFSVDVPEVVFALVHPGRVETGLVEFKEEGAMTMEESVSQMLGLVDGLGKADSGRFMDRFGETIGW